MYIYSKKNLDYRFCKQEKGLFQHQKTLKSEKKTNPAAKMIQDCLVKFQDSSYYLLHSMSIITLISMSLIL